MSQDIVIQLYPYSRNEESFYEIVLGKFSEIKFVHRQKIILNKILSNSDASPYFEYLKNFKFPLYLEHKIESYLIDPELEMRLKISCGSFVADVSWTNNQEINYESEFYSLKGIMSVTTLLASINLGEVVLLVSP